MRQVYPTEAPSRLVISPWKHETRYPSHYTQFLVYRLAKPVFRDGFCVCRVWPHDVSIICAGLAGPASFTFQIKGAMKMADPPPLQIFMDCALLVCVNHVSAFGEVAIFTLYMSV